MLFPVASPSKPPNVMIGVKQAKYRKKIDATDCNTKASVKSEIYQGYFRLMSLINPPNILQLKYFIENVKIIVLFAYLPDLFRPERSRSNSSSSSESTSCSFSCGFLRVSCDGT